MVGLGPCSGRSATLVGVKEAGRWQAPRDEHRAAHREGNRRRSWAERLVFVIACSCNAFTIHADQAFESKQCNA